MTTELRFLIWSSVLGMAHLGAAALAKRVQEPALWAAGARDEGQPDYTGLAARLMRAQDNFMETYPFFVTLVLACHAAGREGALSLWGVNLYFWARCAFLPVYALGTRFLRTAIWMVSIMGLLLIILASLPG